MLTTHNSKGSPDQLLFDDDHMDFLVRMVAYMRILNEDLPGRSQGLWGHIRREFSSRYPALAWFAPFAWASCYRKHEAWCDARVTFYVSAGIDHTLKTASERQPGARGYCPPPAPPQGISDLTDKQQ